MKDKLVTLFGGGGFVGRYAAQSLLRAGARVRIAQRDPREAWFLKPLGGLGQTQFVGADMSRPSSVANAVAGADAVVIAAGGFGNPQKLFVEGPANVSRAATTAGVETLVHISAIGADEASPSEYGRSKAAGEAAVREAFPGAAILRPSVVFGPEDQFINRFARMIAFSPVIPIMRAPARFQPVYAADVGEAVQVVVAQPQQAAARTFELGGPDIVTMGELQRWIARTIARDPGFVELPDMLGALLASAGFLPGAPISRDQWLMLQRDSVVAADVPGLAELGIAPTPMNAVAPAWLVRFRREGRFNKRVDQLAA